jgi:sugar-phosphatase
MDGVLIDSEPLWRLAMIKGFNNIGIEFTEDDCRKTTGMRFKEVVEIWIKHHGIKNISNQTIEASVLELLTELIAQQGRPIPGIMDVYHFCETSGLKVGLATSSSEILVKAVLKKLELENGFDAVVSAERMTYGKPHPEVFLVCASMLDLPASECIVIEDSLNGVFAAKAAQMKVFAVPDAEHKSLRQFAAADWQCENMEMVLRQFKELTGAKTA